ADGYEGDLSHQLEKGDLKLEFSGKKLKGTFALVHTKREGNDNQWLLIKKEDGFSTNLAYDSEEFIEKEELFSSSSSIDINQMVTPMLATKANTIFSKP